MDAAEARAVEGEAPLTWYARDERAAPWRICACPEHGRELERHRFRQLGTRWEQPGGGVRAAEQCAICRTPQLLGEVERCTCEEDPARCPEHQNRGCGW